MGVWTVTPRTWAVGEVVTAANINSQLRDFAAAFGAQTAYTPVWGSSGTAPAVGNGTSAGLYTQIGKTVVCEGKLLLGSTSTIGTGNYTFSLPVAALNSISNVAHGSWWFRRGGTDYSGFCLLNGTTISLRQHTAGGSVLMGAAAPAVPASGDWISWSLNYETT